mmetsp:Transcript_26866/g.44337  ORF Transcript_26866/g.44337 Transcript_26866/m.44337 type:complete len:90 (+) Transcript_26866:576-845(+)
MYLFIDRFRFYLEEFSQEYNWPYNTHLKNKSTSVILQTNPVCPLQLLIAHLLYLLIDCLSICILPDDCLLIKSLTVFVSMLSILFAFLP